MKTDASAMSRSRGRGGWRLAKLPGSSIWLLLLVLMVINGGFAPPATATLAEDLSGMESGNVQQPGTERILSRKRRYLIFPKGSSLQLVYDMVYPILDKANLIYIGITGALAYQLPFEPINVEAALRGPPPNANSDDRIASTSGQPTAPNPTQQTDMRQPQPPSVDRYYTQPKDSYYQSGGRPAPVRTTGGTYYIGSPDAPPDRQPGVADKFSNKLDYYFTQANRLVDTINAMNKRKIDPWKRVSWSQTPSTNRFAPTNPFGVDPQQTQYAPPSAPSSSSAASSSSSASSFASSAQRRTGGTNNPHARQHAIHPVFGRKKRSTADGQVADVVSDVERIHLKLHRSTRHTLYRRIAKLIDMKNMDGKECVQRALCETSQQRTEGEPESFLAEIMRAIFSMPLLQDVQQQPNGTAGGRQRREAEADPMHRMYDAAIVTGRGRADCAQLFEGCAGSVWSGAFNM